MFISRFQGIPEVQDLQCARNQVLKFRRSLCDFYVTKSKNVTYFNSSREKSHKQYNGNEVFDLAVKLNMIEVDLFNEKANIEPVSDEFTKQKGYENKINDISRNKNLHYKNENNPELISRYSNNFTTRCLPEDKVADNTLVVSATLKNVDNFEPNLSLSVCEMNNEINKSQSHSDSCVKFVKNRHENISTACSIIDSTQEIRCSGTPSHENSLLDLKIGNVLNMQEFENYSTSQMDKNAAVEFTTDAGIPSASDFAQGLSEMYAEKPSESCCINFTQETKQVCPIKRQFNETIKIEKKYIKDANIATDLELLERLLEVIKKQRALLAVITPDTMDCLNYISLLRIMIDCQNNIPSDRSWFSIEISTKIIVVFKEIIAVYLEFMKGIKKIKKGCCDIYTDFFSNDLKTLQSDLEEIIFTNTCLAKKIERNFKLQSQVSSYFDLNKFHLQV